MKNTIDYMSILIEQHNMSLPEGAQKANSRDKTEDHERFHALKAGFSKSHAFLVDSGASNHMVTSKESLYSLQLTDGQTIHIGDDTQIQAERKGSIKFEHGVFKNVLYVYSLAANLLSVFQMTHTGSLKRVVFGPNLVEISDISIGKLIVNGVANHASKAY